MSVFDVIRAAAAEVAQRASQVRIDPAALARLSATAAGAFGQGATCAPDDDPAHLRLDSDVDTLWFVITLDAINFGSGWFPFVSKRSGCSGYQTFASALRERFARDGAWSARELAGLRPETLAKVLEQEVAVPEVAELMDHFASALRELGALLESRYEGSAEALVASAKGSAAALVEALAEMPAYRDVARYDELEVPLYKRAQITVFDLSQAFAGAGPGRFDDLDALTMFADNLVPHVLRREGVLRYAPGLAAHIDAGELLPAGSREEVEIRAVALHAVEGMLRRVPGASAARLDSWLWQRGQRPEIKAHPRHRTRTLFY